MGFFEIDAYKTHPATFPDTQTGPEPLAQMRDKHGLGDEIYEEMSSEVIAHACRTATKMGRLVPEAGGSLTHMAPERMITGDGTVHRPRYDATPGDMQVDPVTGEIEQIRHDPDARFYETEGGRRVVHGIKFVHLESRSFFERESVLLAVQHQPEATEGGEAAVALQMIRQVRPLLPGMQGVAWDKALRGKHIDELYDLALQAVVKVSVVKGGKPKSRRLGTHPARLNGLEHDVDVVAVGGAVTITVPIRGNVEPVRCDKVKVAMRQGKTRVRWYGTYRIPNEAPVPPRLRGAEFTIRFNGRCAGDPPTLNRAEVIRPVAEGDDEWQRLYHARPGTESTNAWVKDRLHKRRAPALGAARQRFEFMCMQLFVNIRALLAYRRRIGEADPLPAAA